MKVSVQTEQIIFASDIDFFFVKLKDCVKAVVQSYSRGTYISCATGY